MATFYSTAVDGTGVSLALNATGPGSPPASGITFRVDFDKDTNAALIGQFNAASQTFSLSGGTLTVGGTPATVNAPSALYAAKQNLPALAAKAAGAGPVSWSSDELSSVVTLVNGLAAKVSL